MSESFRVCFQHFHQWRNWIEQLFYHWLGNRIVVNKKGKVSIKVFAKTVKWIKLSEKWKGNLEILFVESLIWYESMRGSKIVLSYFYRSYSWLDDWNMYLLGSLCLLLLIRYTAYEPIDFLVPQKISYQEFNKSSFINSTLFSFQIPCNHRLCDSAKRFHNRRRITRNRRICNDFEYFAWLEVSAITHVL